MIILGSYSREWRKGITIHTGSVSFPSSPGYSAVWHSIQWEWMCADGAGGCSKYSSSAKVVIQSLQPCAGSELLNSVLSWVCLLPVCPSAAAIPLHFHFPQWAVMWLYFEMKWKVIYCAQLFSLLWMDANLGQFPMLLQLDLTWKKKISRINKWEKHSRTLEK